MSAAVDGVERRQHGHSPWRTAFEMEHEARMAAITKPRQVKDSPSSVEIGQEARTKQWYCKSLVLTQRENETDLEWEKRIQAARVSITAELNSYPSHEETPFD